MSGIIGSKINIRGSGRVAKLGTDGQALTSGGAGVAVNYEDVAGGISWQAVETGSTMTAVAGNGYPIDTTSNACTITLPSSASNGDQIIFTDYARNWGTNKITLDSNGLNYQGDSDASTVEYTTDGQSVRIVYSGATNGWIPTLDQTVENVPSKGNQEGIFLWGGESAGTNLISNVGVVSADTSTPGGATARTNPGATQYGADTGIVAFGTSGSAIDESNLITNAGVVGADVTGVGTDRTQVGACSFGTDYEEGIMAFGYTTGYVSMSNLISNAGVVATDVTGVGTARYGSWGCEYGGDKGIIAFGFTGSATGVSNLVSNAGVVAADVSAVGTPRQVLGGCSYGSDKGIFAFGYTGSSVSVSNLVSNVGVIASDTTGVGTARYYVCACEYGGDKGIMGLGTDGTQTAITNLVSNTGVVATDTAAVAGVTARQSAQACSFN